MKCLSNSAHRINNRITLDLILHGCKKLSYSWNTRKFDVVYSFIKKYINIYGLT